MSAFARLDRAAQAVHEATFGEAFTLKPMKRAADVNARWQADATRPEAALTAIYRQDEVSPDMPQQLDERVDQKPGVASRVHSIEIDPRRQAANVNAGDVLVRATDASRWRISAVETDTMGRLICAVSRVA